MTDYRDTFLAITAPPEVEKQYRSEHVHADDPQLVLSDALRVSGLRCGASSAPGR